MSGNSRICGNCFFEVPNRSADYCPKCGYLLGPAELPDALPVGTILNGRYVIGKALGQGGFGITYKSLDHKTGDVVAVKEFFPSSLCHRASEAHSISIASTGTNDDFYWGRERFLREAETLAGLGDLPGIVHVHEYFEENGTAYFSMDYVEGQDLKGYLKQHGGRIRWDELKLIVLPIMSALEAVHNRGIIHRDISPDNIYIKENGEAVLLDFGAARASLGERSKSISVILKPGFAPKEQYFSRGKQGRYTDVYAMGATIYRCLTGIEPPESLERSEDIATGAQDPLKPIHDFAPVDSGIEAAVLKALSIEASDRFQTMKDFEYALNNSDHQEMIVTPKKAMATRIEVPDRNAQRANPKVIKEPAGDETSAHVPTMSRRTLIGIACGAGAAVVAGIAVAAVNGARSNQPPTPSPSSESSQESNESSQTFATANSPTQTSALPIDQAYAVLYSDGELVFQDGQDTQDGRDVVHAGTVDVTSPWWIGTYTTTLTIGESNTITGDYYDKVKKVSSSVPIAGVKDMSLLFTCCTSLTDISGLAKWDLSSTSNLAGMFRGCFKLNDLSPLRSWDVSSVTDMTYLFNACQTIADLSPLTNWDVSSVQTMKGVFAGCTAIKSAKGLEIWNISAVKTLEELFDSCSSLNDISVLSSWNPEYVTSLNGTFNGCKALKDISALSSWNVSSVTNLSKVLQYCAIKDLGPLVNWEVSSVTSANGAFENCSALSDVTALSSWKLRSINDIQGLFSSCTALADISPLSAWNTSTVTLMRNLFSGCTAIKDLNALSSWDVSSVTAMNSMFSGCSALSDVNGLSDWNVSAVTDMSYMFSNCTSLKDATHLSSWKVNPSASMNHMFENCAAALPSWTKA